MAEDFLTKVLQDSVHRCDYQHRRTLYPADVSPALRWNGLHFLGESTHTIVSTPLRAGHPKKVLTGRVGKSTASAPAIEEEAVPATTGKKTKKSTKKSAE